MIRTATTLLALAAIAPAAFAQTASPEAAAPAPAWPEISATAPDFTLPNVLAEDGSSVTLSDVLGSKPYAAIIWHSINCPFVRPYESVLPGMAQTYGERGVQFIAINSNGDEDNAAIRERLGAAGFNFPVLKDEGSALADQYGAQNTPEVFLVDANRHLLYHGQISDNSSGPGADGEPTLANVLDAVLAGQQPPVTETPHRGCQVHRAN
jgi:thiol-disulfide isomerase/thioredoxin